MDYFQQGVKKTEGYCLSRPLKGEIGFSAARAEGVPDLAYSINSQTSLSVTTSQVFPSECDPCALTN